MLPSPLRSRISKSTSASEESTSIVLAGGIYRVFQDDQIQNNLVSKSSSKLACGFEHELFLIPCSETLADWWSNPCPCTPRTGSLLVLDLSHCNRVMDILNILFLLVRSNLGNASAWSLEESCNILNYPLNFINTKTKQSQTSKFYESLSS